MRTFTANRVRSASMTAVLASIALAAGGCNNAGEGAFSGAALGAGAGAIIGSLYGAAGNGAAIGAVAGGLGGAILGDQNERRSRNYGAYPNYGAHPGSYSGGYYYQEYSYSRRNHRHCDW